MGGCVSGTGEKARRWRKLLWRLLSSSSHRPALVTATPVGYAGILGNHFLPPATDSEMDNGSMGRVQKSPNCASGNGRMLDPGRVKLSGHSLIVSCLGDPGCSGWSGWQDLGRVGRLWMPASSGLLPQLRKGSSGVRESFQGNTRKYPRMVNLQAGTAHWVGVHCHHRAGAKLLWCKQLYRLPSCPQAPALLGETGWSELVC